MKGFITEFKEFALKGNVMDMAVGIIIGGAFTAIVTSLVDDLINPIIGLLCGKDFSNLSAVFFWAICKLCSIRESDGENFKARS